MQAGPAVRRNHDNWDIRMLHDIVADASQDHFTECTQTSSSGHDQPGTLPFGDLDDARAWRTFLEDRSERNAFLSKRKAPFLVEESTDFILPVGSRDRPDESVGRHIADDR